MDQDRRPTIVGVSCGGCCNKDYPCEKCLGETLAANGIPKTKIDKFRGLRNKNNGGYQYPWSYSELYTAVKKWVYKELGLEYNG